MKRVPVAVGTLAITAFFCVVLLIWLSPSEQQNSCPDGGVGCVSGDYPLVGVSEALVSYAPTQTPTGALIFFAGPLIFIAIVTLSFGVKSKDKPSR